MSQTKKITEGAMIVTIIGVVLVLNRSLGNILEFGFMWILSLPIIIYTSKYGLKFGSIVAFSLFILAFILGSTFSTMFYICVEMIIGVGYGLGILKRYSNKKMLTYIMIIEFIAMFLSISVFASLLGYDIVKETQSIAVFLNGINNNLNLKGIIILFFLITPVFTALGEGCCIHCFAHLICSKMNIEIEPLKPLNQFNVSKTVARLSMITLVIYIVFLICKIEGFWMYCIVIITLLLFVAVLIKGIANMAYRVQGNKLKVFVIMFTSMIPMVNFYHYIRGIMQIFKE